MTGPYLMVLISIISSFAFIIILFVYYFIAKKKINLLVLLVLLALLPVLSIFREGTYESGDLSIHIAYSMSFFKSLAEGHIMPVWSADLNAGSGYPLFGFSYILPYYLISLVHFLGFNFTLSTKIILALSFISSGMAMYFWALEEFKSHKAAFIAGVLYLFAPYHLVDLHFRVDIGEVVSFVFIPLVFLFTKKVSTNYSSKWIMLGTLSIFLLILSHQAISFITVFFLVVYIFIMYRKTIIQCFIPIFLGIGLSTYYWLPIFLEKKFTLPASDQIFYTNFSDLIFSPWMFGLLFQRPFGQLVFPIGYLHIILITVAVYLIFANKITHYKNILIIFIFFTIFCLFLITELSSTIWSSLPVINNFQFSYRLMGIVIFFTSAISAIVLHKSRNYLIIICTVVAVWSTILNWGNRNMIQNMHDNRIYNSIKYGGIGLDPAFPIWLKNWKTELAHFPLVSVPALIKSKETYYGSTLRKYSLELKSDAQIFTNISFFPGWNAIVDGTKTTLNPYDNSNQGLITIQVPKNTKQLLFIFEDTLVRKISKIVSLVFLAFIVIYLYVYRIAINSKSPRRF